MAHPQADAPPLPAGQAQRSLGFFDRLRHLEEPTDDLPTGRLRTILGVMGLPTLGLAFAITMVTTYGPVVLLRVAHSPTKVGLLIGGEGAFALIVPIISGGLSDRLSGTGRFGRRLPFAIAGGPLLMAGLILLPLSPDYLVAAIAVLMFYVGYYLFYPPYRAIYADVLSRPLYARAQASQAIMRGAGLGAALLTGGLLLGIDDEFPFVVAAVLLAATAAALLPISRLGDHSDAASNAEKASVRRLLLQNSNMRKFALANSLWEFSFAGLKSFIVLYVIRGLGQSAEFSSAVIAVVAVAYVVGAPIAARLADRFGMVRTMSWSALVFGVGLCYAGLPTTPLPLMIVLPFFALAGAILLTLPQALAFLCAPEGNQGVAAGLVDVSRGVGLVLGPIAVGAAISAAPSWLSATHGYAAMWPIIGVANLVSLPILNRMRSIPGA